MPTYSYPNNYELTEIAQVLQPEATVQADPLFALGIAEVVPRDTDQVIWQQKDNYTGLQMIRGINGAPFSITRPGSKLYSLTPGVFGEFDVIDERELTERGRYVLSGAPVSLDDLVMTLQEILVHREITRIRQILWTLLTTGTFSVSSPLGQIQKTDTFPLQTFTSTVSWGTFATATPLNDFRSVQQFGPEAGTNFGSDAYAFTNRATFNKMMRNTNTADIAGRRTNGLNTMLALNLNEVNTVLLGEDLPQIVVMDGGYYNDAGVFTRYIPNDKVVVFGARPMPGPLVEYVLTRNANNPGSAPGSYSLVIEKRDQVPVAIEVHQGHNGAPAIYFPGSVMIMNV